MAVGVKVAVGVAVSVGVGVKVGVFVAVGVLVAVGVFVGVFVAVAVGVAVGVWVGVGVSPLTVTFTVRSLLVSSDSSAQSCGSTRVERVLAAVRPARMRDGERLRGARCQLLVNPWSQHAPHAPVHAQSPM